MTISTIAFIDTFTLHALLYKNRGLFDKGTDATRTIDIWGKLKTPEWKAAKSVVVKCLESLRTYNSGERPQLAGVAIERLQPRSTTPWSLDLEYATGTHCFHLPIATNPACMVYSGFNSLHLAVGQLAFIGTDVLHCSANHGDTPRYHLVIDIKRPEPALDEPPAQPITEDDAT